MQRYGSAIFNRLGNRIFVKIAMRGIGNAEGLESALTEAGLINGCACETNVGGIGQCTHEKGTEDSACGPMGFIDQNEDVLPGVDISLHSLEFMNHRDDQAPMVFF